MIFRRGFWDMPKGKLDKGETIEECAVREVKEETGIKKLKLVRPLAVSYHSYDQGTHHLLKESHWFLMKTKSSEDLVAQREEDILEIEWVIPEKIDGHLAHAYPSIVDVVELYLQSSKKATQNRLDG